MRAFLGTHESHTVYYYHAFVLIFAGARDTVINPKVNNMLNAYENAKHPLFMISDAGIRSKYHSMKISHNYFYGGVAL